jgi:hypothetical protein
MNLKLINIDKNFWDKVNPGQKYMWVKKGKIHMRLYSKYYSIYSKYG